MKSQKTLSRQFIEFLQQHNLLSLAIAFVMGGAVTSLVKSLVENIIMPLINPLLGEIPWQDAILTIGSISIKWGSFGAELIHFLILAFIVFLFARKLVKN